MGLCRYVFASDPREDAVAEEVAECDVGHYSDFGCFRDAIACHLAARRYPTLMDHSDCDGEWALDEVPRLERELREIKAGFQRLPPDEPRGAFEHTAEHRVGARSLYDCFHEVNGQNLFEALLDLCAAAREHGRPITFM
jgi:hypothetical protein